jgi:hypothetical protein
MRTLFGTTRANTQLAMDRLLVLKAEAFAGNHDPWVLTDTAYMKTDINVDRIARAQVLLAVCGGEGHGHMDVLTPSMMNILLTIPNPRGAHLVYYRPQPLYKVDTSDGLAGHVLEAQRCEETASDDDAVQDLDNDDDPPAYYDDEDRPVYIVD